MATLHATVISGDFQVFHYQHPFLITYNQSSKTMTIWNTDVENQSVDLEGAIYYPFRKCCYIHSDRVIVWSSISESYSYNMDQSVVGIYSIPSGARLDSLSLPSCLSSHGGHSNYMGHSDGRIAIWISENHDEYGYIRLYSLTDEGKLHRLHDLYPPVLPSSLQDVSPLRMVEIVPLSMLHFTPDFFIGCLTPLLSDSTVHLVRWSSTKASQTPSSLAHVDFPARQAIIESDIDYHYLLYGHIYIASRDEIIFAHYETPSDRGDYAPITILRCVHAQTLALRWSTPIFQKLDKLRYVSLFDGLLVAIGWTWDAQERQRVEEAGRDDFVHDGVIVLNAHTGTVLRTDYLGPPSIPCGQNHLRGFCDVSPTGEDIIVAYGDGQLAIRSLPDFVKGGFLRQEVVEDGDILGLVKVPLITRPCTVGDTFDGSNSRRRAKVRRHKERGTWEWASDALVGNGTVIFVPRRTRGFVVVKWQ